MAAEKKKSFIQFIKFGIVGLSNTVISYVTYAVLVFFGCPYLVANLISFIVSVLNSFYWNNRYVFKVEDGQKRNWILTLIKTFASYSITGLFLSSFLLWLWIDVFSISAYIAPIINLIITVPLNFVMNKFWAFRTKADTQSAEIESSDQENSPDVSRCGQDDSSYEGDGKPANEEKEGGNS